MYIQVKGENFNDTISVCHNKVKQYSANAKNY